MADVQQGRAAENLQSSDRWPDLGLLGNTLPRALGTIGGNVSPAPEYSSQPGLQNGAKPDSAACCHPAVALLYCWHSWEQAAHSSAEELFPEPNQLLHGLRAHGLWIAFVALSL